MPIIELGVSISFAETSTGIASNLVYGGGVHLQKSAKTIPSLYLQLNHGEKNKGAH